jgi:micrococcal nuclease
MVTSGDRTNSMRRFILCIAVLASACREAPSPSTSSPADSSVSAALVANAELITVIDGDTIVVDVFGTDGEEPIEERVRLIGIDTPETKKPDTPVECFGPEATVFTQTLLPKGTALHLERDVEARDAYGRLLAYVYRVNDGLFVNLEVIAQGYARLLTFPPNVAHTDAFVAAAKAAREANAGLWQGCSG